MSGGFEGKELPSLKSDFSKVIHDGNAICKMTFEEGYGLPTSIVLENLELGSKELYQLDFEKGPMGGYLLYDNADSEGKLNENGKLDDEPVFLGFHQPEYLCMISTLVNDAIVKATVGDVNLEINGQKVTFDNQSDYYGYIDESNASLQTYLSTGGFNQEDFEHTQSLFKRVHYQPRMPDRSDVKHPDNYDLRKLENNKGLSDICIMDLSDEEAFPRFRLEDSSGNFVANYMYGNLGEEGEQNGVKVVTPVHFKGDDLEVTDLYLNDLKNIELIYLKLNDVVTGALKNQKPKIVNVIREPIDQEELFKGIDRANAFLKETYRELSGDTNLPPFFEENDFRRALDAGAGPAPPVSTPSLAPGAGGGSP